MYYYFSYYTILYVIILITANANYVYINTTQKIIHGNKLKRLAREGPKLQSQ